MNKDTKNTQPPSVARGFVLGIVIFVVFVLSAIVVYVLAGAGGWKGNTQIIVGLCAGPIVGLILMGLYFVVFKPNISGR